ncbi:hypothetical protein [Amycolatopsis thermophila]|uniref:Glycosyl transferase family 2 n=1 Tax=Amycolatopsis thermophila TaxID=206084 RepID=A0ABU0ESA8_9PSEU|nr:hypothetical protein [Amycolatopsis thermophila]MDQ0378185.1 hypothetical protein [Amycolatopsis thermophila]
MALARATSEIVRTLDADDLLLPGALARDVQALSRVAWCTSACVDLLPDGSTRPGPDDPPGGPVPPGRFFKHEAHDADGGRPGTAGRATALRRSRRPTTLRDR